MRNELEILASFWWAVCGNGWEFDVLGTHRSPELLGGVAEFQFAIWPINSDYEKLVYQRPTKGPSGNSAKSASSERK